jgi:lysophospholipase L1-like esterase
VFRIACIGDSHTAGFPNYDPVWGGNPESTYMYHLNIKLQIAGIQANITNHGICGETSGLILRRIPRILQMSPTHVILISGANDVGWGINTSKIIENVEKSLILIEDNNSIPILCNIPPMSVFNHDDNPVKKLNGELREQLDQKSIAYVDLWETLSDPTTNGLHSDFDSGDGVHLNINGYKRVAQAIYPIILPLLK